MKFYNRELELETLKLIIDSAKKKSSMVVISGRRRIGKTRLVNESLKKLDYIDFFFPVKEKGLVLNEFSKEIKKKLGYSPEFKNFEEFLEYLFTQKNNLIVFFDEFQNMDRVDKGFFYSLQKYWDKYKEQKRFTIFISGSYIGTIKKLFQNKKAPLYGRLTSFFKLKPLSLAITIKILTDLDFNNVEDQLKIYGIFGGVPRYYEFLEGVHDKSFSNVIKELFINEGSVLIYEGKNILIEEFGKKYKIYFSILEAVSNGRNTISEIAGAIQQKPNTIVKYLIVLEDYYEVLGRRYPVTEKRSKKSRYFIQDYFLLFWFRFIQSNKNLFEENRSEELLGIIKKEFNQFFGKVFEEIVKDLIIILNKNHKFIFQPTKIGKWWGHYRNQEGKRKELEIDICAINEKTKEILFCECKWKDKVNPEKILKELKEKSKYVDWNNNKRKEHYAIFAKSFSKKIKGVYLFDLKDLKKRKF